MTESLRAATWLFAALSPQPADALLALIGLHHADARPDKIDVGVGVYRDDAGNTPVMRAMKAAERRLTDEQDSKSYLGAEGDTDFIALLEPLVFGPGHSVGRAGVQTPGGTGALRLGAELIARASPTARLWMGTPSWANHAPIFRAAGLRVETHRFFDGASMSIDFEGMLIDLAAAKRGDVVLLHGCCHNPTGADFTIDQWRVLAGMIAERGLIPFIDLAYQGLGDGLESDATGARVLLEAVPEALIAYSCDKNFGLYRDRVGALWIQADGAAARDLARQNILALARSLWSMPPDHGAALVRMILADTALTRDWRDELEGMRRRLWSLRQALAKGPPRLAAIAEQRGLFATLPLDTDAVATLRDRHAIYIAPGGRLNIAGLRAATIAPFIVAIAPYLDRPR